MVRSSKKRVSFPMVIIGLTGSIGMGKSTVAGIFTKLGFPVYSADQAVHALLKRDGSAVAPVARLFPESFKRGVIKRDILGQIVFSNPDKLKKLEAIIHPLLMKAERHFLRKARQARVPAVVLEIPLLFETGADKRCHVILCTTAPLKVQKSRVLSRPGMNEKKFRAILLRQLPDAIKRKKSDYIIPTATSPQATEKHLRSILIKMGLMA